MAARGILENPGLEHFPISKVLSIQFFLNLILAMFGGYTETPIECIKDWMKIALETGTSFTHFHHHLIYMCEKNMSRIDRKYFNALSSTTAVVDFMEEYLSLCA